jgi:hypothetical protein
MINPTNDEWIDVYDASNNPDALKFEKYSLETGKKYTFRVFAVNFNGRSS